MRRASLSLRIRARIGAFLCVSFWLAAVQAPLAQETLSIEDLAATDPAAALDRLLDGSSRSSELYAAAGVWARNDPAAIVERMRTIDEPVKRDQFIQALLFQWSIEDTAEVLQFAASLEDWDLRVPESRPGVIMNLRIDFPIRADADLEEIMALADDVPPNLARVVRVGVIRRMSQADPPLAASYLDEVDEVSRRGVALGIARDYVEFDRHAALEWAASLGIPDVEQTIYWTIAIREPHEAVELAIERGDSSVILSTASEAVRSPSARPAAIIERVMQLPEANEGRGWLSFLVQSWTQSDPSSALEWLVAQADLPEAVYRAAAERLSQRPDLAVEYADRMPGAMRDVWIAATIEMFVGRDPASAQIWLDRYRGSDGYRAAVSSVARSVARTDAPGAARLIDQNELWDDQALVMQVAGGWMAADRPAAAAWAMRVPDAESRLRAIMSAAGSWALQDPMEAEQWVLNQPAGDDRDRFLQSLVAGTIESDPGLAERLFQAFSSDESRQSAAFLAATRILRDNEAEARRLIAEYVTSPELSAEFERYLEPRDLDRSCNPFRIVC